MERTRSRVRGYTLSELSSAYNGDWKPVYVFCVDRQKTVDEEHPWYQFVKLRKNPRAAGYVTGVDIGGDFTSTSSTAELTGDVVGINGPPLRGFPYKGDYLYKFKGTLVPNVPAPGPLRSDVAVEEPMQIGASVRAYDSANNVPNLWGTVSETDEELAVLGASLVSKLAPTAPHNSVYTSLGELRNDGLPSIPFVKLLRELKDGKLAENVGGEYLNYQFGIAPTISDVKSILETVSNADKLWKQYLRDSGRLVRRRMDMDPEVTTETGVLYNGTAYIPVGTVGNQWSSVGPITHTTTTTRKRWFSAGYLYYVHPESLNGMAGFLEKSNYLYGWKPTPSAMYNLTAWSWLLDWFTNTGDVIDNVSLYLQDPFLTRFAYIMEETTMVREISQTNRVNTDGSSLTASVRLTTTTKKRRKVNPLHMGFKGEALNGHQLSILAALGLTRFSNPGSM